MNWKKVKSMCGIGLLLGATALGAYGCAPDYTQEQVDKMVADAKQDGIDSVNVEQIKTDAKAEVDVTTDNQDAIKEAIKDIPNVALDEATGLVILEEVQEEPEIVEPTILVGGKILDELTCGDTIEGTYDDSDVETFFDGKIEFDGEDYDAREYMTLTSDAKIVCSGPYDEDFADKMALAFMEKNALQHVFEFDNPLGVTKLDEDTTLQFKFLKQNLKIVSVGDNEVTMSFGSEHYLKVGDSVEKDGKKITLLNVGEGGSLIVQVGEETETVSSGETETINGVQVRMVEKFYETTKSERSATIEIGEDINKVIKNGDEVEEFKDLKEDTWEWVVESSAEDETLTKIAVKYTIKADDADEEVLFEGDSLKLPNGYAEVMFKETNNPEYTKVDTSFGEIELNDEDVNALLIHADKQIFEFGHENTNEVAVAMETIYWENENEWEEITQQVTLNWGDTTLELEATETGVQIGQVTLNTNEAMDGLGAKEDAEAEDVKFGEVNLGTRDNDVLLPDGVILRSVENNAEDDKARLEVPDDHLEATVTINTVE